MRQSCTIERDGSMVKHETRIREVPGSNPVASNLVEVFSGFLNLKITKELVISKDKCRVGPHIPLQMYKFNISQDLNKMVNYFTSEVAQQMAVKSNS